MQQETQRPVYFEITEQTRDALAASISGANLGHTVFRIQEFFSRCDADALIGLRTREYVRGDSASTRFQSTAAAPRIGRVAGAQGKTVTQAVSLAATSSPEGS